MTDNQIYAILFPFIRQMLPIYGVRGCEVVQGFQQQKQGPATAPSVVIHKIADKRYGFPHRTDEWVEYWAEMVRTETIQMESTFQVNGLGVVNGSTTMDIVGTVASILQSDAFLEVLRAAGMGVLRITDIRQTYFHDDRDQYAADPSFDFVLTHKHVYVSTANRIDEFEYQIKRV